MQDCARQMPTSAWKWGGRLKLCLDLRDEVYMCREYAPVLPEKVGVPNGAKRNEKLDIILPCHNSN